MVIDNGEVKILIVDDTPENLLVSAKILETEKYDVYTAENGRVALQMLENVLFDLVLLDIMMPVMDGFEVCRRIKENPAFQDIPIIFLSALTDIDSVAEGFTRGAVDYIRKPCNVLELVARVKTHVELKKIREELEKKSKKLEEAYAELEIIATTDPLTGLYNRRELLSRLDDELARFERNGVRFSLIMADIDDFKKINDSYGHECGDFILKSVADVFKAGTRRQDRVARWGGEEFLLLLPATGRTGAAVLAEKLRSRVASEAFTYNANRINITMTFGVSDVFESDSIDDIIRSADEALYSGKQKGRNCVVQGMKADG